MVRRLVIFAILAVTVCAAPAQTNRQIRNLQSESKSLKKQITQSEQLLRSTKKDVKSQLSNLALLSGQIDDQRRYVAGIEAEVKQLDSNIVQLSAQVKKLVAELNECKRKYSRSVVYMYKNRSTQNKLMFLFSAKNFSQMFRRMRYMMEYAKYQRAQGEIIREKETAVRNKQNELLSTKAQKNQLLAAGRTEQAKLEGQQKEREGIVSELKKRQSKLQNTIAQTRKRYNSLNAKIDRLIQQEIEAAERRRREEEARRRREAERKAKAEAAARAKKGKSGKKSSSSASASKKTATPSFREPSSADVKLNRNFAANKGRLPMPITGPYVLTGRFGKFAVPGLKGVQLDNKGINITGKAGAQARCIFNGEVTAVFPYNNMVNVIVRHGSYISVYCNLQSTSVRKGQQVNTGQVLGRVANDGSGNCTLHFQLRKEKTKLNPEQWLRR